MQGQISSSEVLIRICFVMRISTRYTLYQSAECIVISSCWWRPKFHKLLTMRQAASVSSVYNSRKGCTAQYLAGAGVSLLNVFAVQKPEHFTLTFLYNWGPVEHGQQCLVELNHKSWSYYPNCPSTQPSLSRRKIMQKLAFAISCLATFQIKSRNSTKHQDCVKDKVPKEQP